MTMAITAEQWFVLPNIAMHCAPHYEITPMMNNPPKKNDVHLVLIELCRNHGNMFHLISHVFSHEKTLSHGKKNFKPKKTRNS